MSFKFNNRLVHHGTSRNSTFLLVFLKVHEIRSLKQSTILDACTEAGALRLLGRDRGIILILSPAMSKFKAPVGARWL